jgi:diguanylate cyclase (GGDEF)-like protein
VSAAPEAQPAPGPGLPQARAAVRHLFRRRSDPYGDVDMARATRLGGVLWIVGSVCAGLLLAASPPTQAIGDAGWAIAAASLLGCIAGAFRLLRHGSRVGPNELLAMSYVALALIALLDWLAGGADAAFDRLYLLSVVYTACVHPPRRVLAFLGAFLLADASPLIHRGWDPALAGEIGIQAFLLVGIGLVGLVLMEGIRTQRATLRDEGDSARRLAETDQLTGLGNRRRLILDLEEELRGASAEHRIVLVLFDLDGFKSYNDTFGHPAGDTLLMRLGERLDECVRGRAQAYRMGGDEFCVLGAVNGEGAVREMEADAVAALSEHGEGFTVTSSYGSVLLPRDTGEADEALRIADQRMYAHKNLGRASAGQQSADVLLRVLSERNPSLGMHVDEVTMLCERVGRRLELPDEEMAALLQAASLHDVGKAAIPDAILEKPGPLTPGEWEFMRRHTIIGERILGAAPALARAARLVRSSHERFDGSGYPDGLAGREIPIGSRVIAVCDAYDAMTSDRAYRPPMSPKHAISELRACAGVQFDPDVVDAFCAVLDEHGLPRLRLGAAGYSQ